MYYIPCICTYVHMMSSLPPDCRAICHEDCKTKVPLPCVPNVPTPKKKQLVRSTQPLHTTILVAQAMYNTPSSASCCLNKHIPFISYSIQMLSTNLSIVVLQECTLITRPLYTLYIVHVLLSQLDT